MTKSEMICLLRFNPRTRMGCDLGSISATDAEFVFQSTHPHGVRLNSLGAGKVLNSFNPRTRMGCD